MTVGPFDTPIFLGDTEYGGGPGIVQAHEDHEPTVSEQASINLRASKATEAGEGDGSVDPVTGREYI